MKDKALTQIERARICADMQRGLILDLYERKIITDRQLDMLINELRGA